ncbi:MAG: hypothetical protein VX252_16750 [Myxococcota bacterium]|nr:hypothetical protein [Myxococcota bacterium]
MNLSQLIREDTRIEDIAEHLDHLAPAERRDQTLSVDGHLQKTLYERAQMSPPLGLDYFVPTNVANETEVIHFGRNSQPAFKYFQKRWARPSGRHDQLFGYNEARVRPLIGPGYFVAHPTDAEGSDVRGGVVVDYFMMPDAAVPNGWPPIKPNHRGLQMFIYNKTRDYMRRVSEHVSIGIAYRKEKTVLGYFLLCREDAS